ncbi:MAG: ATP-dependent DNA helicase [bacterium]|nr:ATP-dependent DNA helicase [bacterium]
MSAPVKDSSTEASKRKAARKLMQATEFHAAYETLNPQQRLTVDTIEGPVMVVAGPGTGKTQVVALRVANILQKTQMRPSNILCLTFSTSGATAMRQRLRKFIGSDAYSVTVNTIHGFCNDVISSHPVVFEDWNSLEQISDVERYRTVNTIIDQLLPDLKLVNPKSPYSRSRDILSRISQLKREGAVDRDALETIVKTFDQEMVSKSKEGTKIHERNMLTARKFRECIEVFHRYEKMLQDTGRYDYEDMILNVTQALAQEEWMLAGLQERYQYVLVDEFQDTNGSQNKLIELLTKDPTGNNSPNLFVVGDDDQAIYRFQGANLTNILSFRERFPSAPVIALTTSYRCTQKILDAAESLIENNEERLVGKIDGLDKHLVSATEDEGKEPQLLFAASDMTEPWMIADLVEQRVTSGQAPEEIAILVQTNAELLPYYEVLKASGIPVQLSGKLDLLSHPLVQQTLCIIRAIATPENSALLADALSCECFDCHPADLGLLFRLRREQKASLYDLLLILDTEDAPKISLRFLDRVLAARDTIFSLHQKLGSRTVVETLEHIYIDSGLLQDFTKGEMDIVDFAAGQEFFDRIKQRAYEQPNFSFAKLLSDLDFYSNPDYSDLRLKYDLPHLTETGVQLMTAHKSKGLEFQTVILARFREGHWDKRRNPPSITIPEDLLFGWHKDQKSFEKQQDERRVTFVAMTRAKRELLFTCPRELTTGDSTKTVSPSGFFAEAGDLKEVDREVENPEKMSVLLAKPIREFDSEYEAFLRQRIENFAMSPTALNHFLEDPNVFLEIDLMQRPQAKEAQFAYGNAIHHVLAKWAQSVKSGDILTKEQCIAQFSTHLRDRELLTEAENARLEHMGQETLTRYYDQRLQSPYSIIDRIEFGINAHLGDIPIKGKVDRIDLLEPHSSHAVVIDFKTGKPKTPKQIEDYGYHRQLVFYALLMEHGYSIIQPQQFILDFVGEGSEHPVLRTYEVSQTEKRELTELIQQVWAKIIALDFTSL